MSTVDAATRPLLVGHDWAVQLLARGLERDILSQAYLFIGPAHVGKTTLALYLARALNCQAEKARPCGECTACRRIGAGRHADVRVLDDEGGSIKISQIRDLQREISLAPFEGRWRVYILCDFQRATLEAANCLLKTLEEPPPRVVLILTATESELLLPTIISRCQVLNLRPFEAAAIQQALQDHWGLEHRQARLLARLSDGRLGWAIQAIRDDTLLRQREKYLLALEQALRQDRTSRMSLAQRLCQDPLVLPKLFDLWQSWWRDLLLVKSGNEHRLTNVDREQTILHEAQQYTMNDIVGCLRAIRHSAQQVEQNVNACLALELLLLGVPRPTRSGTAPRTTHSGTAPPHNRRRDASPSNTEQELII